MRDRPRVLSTLISLLMGSCAVLATALPAQAAERIIFGFGLLERSISIESLEDFAEDGTVNPDLRLVLSFLDERARADFRQALNSVNRLNPVAVSNSLYDPLGEQSLRFIGNVVQTESRLNAIYALRAAFVLSANQPEGFRTIDVLRNFPSHAVRIDLGQLLTRSRQVDRFFRQTDQAIAGIKTLAEAAAAAEPPLDENALPDVTQPGPYNFTYETVMLTDPERDRTYEVDIYLPIIPEAAPGSIPVAVISHGFGSEPDDFEDVAQHFASHGFAVALPNHIGSDKALQNAVLQGRAFEFFHPSEFLDRPLDISYLLDVLEQRNQAEWGNQLDLKHVTAMGHSFGGYAVLALGGATADLDSLRSSCIQESFGDFLNPALLLQCRALELEVSDPAALQQLVEGVSDERISFVVAVNPVNRIIFGTKGLQNIQVPILIVAGGYDIAAPIVPEQLFSFTQIVVPDRYLLLVEGQAHAPALSEMVNGVLTPSLAPEELDEAIHLMRTNGLGLAVAFSQVYGARNEDYRPLLQSSYALRLNDPPFQFNLIRELTEDQLVQMLAGATR